MCEDVHNYRLIRLMDRVKIRKYFLDKESNIWVLNYRKNDATLPVLFLFGETEAALRCEASSTEAEAAERAAPSAVGLRLVLQPPASLPLSEGNYTEAGICKTRNRNWLNKKD